MMHVLSLREEASLPSLIVFITLLAITLVLSLTVVLVAGFSKHVSRMKTWYSLLISCIVYCVSFLLLIGHQIGPEPPFALCVVQAGLIYAAPPVVAAAALVFVIELYLRLSSIILARAVSKRMIAWMLRYPPLVHTVTFWAAILTGLSNLKKVSRSNLGYFCHIDGSMPTIFIGIVVILQLALMLMTEVYTIVHLYHKRSSVKKITVRGLDFPLGLFIRTATYTFLGGSAIAMTDIFINLNDKPNLAQHVLSVCLALIPLSIVLVFGSQLDILQVLICWKRGKRGDDAEKPTFPSISGSSV